MQEETEAKKVEQVSEIEEVIEKPKSKNGVFSKLFNGLKRTRESLGLGFLRIIKGKKINDELFEELEELLITSDFGTGHLYQKGLTNKKVSTTWEQKII